MSIYKTTENSDLHMAALRSVVQINLESRLTANLINMFRNVLPSVKNYIDEVMIEFKAKDGTDFALSKSLLTMANSDKSISELNMVKKGHSLIQVPEGFKDRYIPYLQWLHSDAIDFINSSKAVLEDYHRYLSIFISSKEAKLGSKDNTRIYADMEAKLTKAKEGLSSFFDSTSSTALRPIESLFDRTSDIKIMAKIGDDLNRERKALRTDEILKLTNTISELLNLLVESSENDKIPEVSGQAANSLAQGALVVAHYVEFVGVLRYRIEEAINASGIAIEQITKIAKE